MSEPEPAAPGAGRRIGLAAYAVVAAVLIGTASYFSVQSATGSNDLRSNLTLIAPAGAGGGWDTFVREQQQVMRTESIVNNAQVVNIPGAGGTIGLGQLATMHGQANTLMATGTVMLGGIELNESPVDLSDVRPVARMAEEYDLIIVPADSELKNVDDLVTAWKKDPKAFPWTGGSAGSIDHLIIADLAIKSGIDAAQITYIPKAGGGEAIQTVTAGTAKAAVGGYAEFADQIESGRVRALGLAAPERLDGVDVPTLTEQGYPVELTNWRGMLAAPGITDEEFAELEDVVDETARSPLWKDAMERNRWTEAYLSGEEFRSFLVEDQKKIAALIEELDL